MLRSPRGRRAAWLAFAMLLGSHAAHALPADCPTFFPDFRCEREARFPGFVPPLTAPYLFEDPFITTGLSAWYLWNQFPDGSILDGGDIQVAALQARIAMRSSTTTAASSTSRRVSSTRWSRFPSTTSS